ncbi:MAG: adenylate/guanylate cyclase domain-containing protein [Oligoflexus sp.]
MPAPVFPECLGGPKRADFTVIGPTVNMASRIESIAKPGEIFLSSTVRDLLRDDSWESAGTFELKGFHAPVHLYRLVAKKNIKAA